MGVSRAAIALALCLAQAQALEQLVASVSLFTPGGQVHDHRQLAGTPGERLARDARVSAQANKSYAIDNFPVDDTGSTAGAASAGFGWLRAETGARHNWYGTGSHAGANAYASASFADIITIDNGTPGSIGVTTFVFRLTGRLREDYGFDSAIAMQSTVGVTIQQQGGVILDSGNPVARHWSWISLPEDPFLNQSLSVSLRYWSGVPIEMSLRLGCSSGYAFGPKSAQQAFGYGLTGCEVGHTLTWQGLAASTDDGGAPLAVRITSLSGADYARAIAAPRIPGAVPEPATWALFLAGFGLAGVAVRRRSLPA